MKIYLGKQTPEHKGDTSRELIDMWEESGYCEVIRNQVDDVFIWANEPDDVLLYEYDRFDVYPGLPNKWNRGLFGGMQCKDERASPWIYWGRRPRKLEAKIKEGIKSYSERSISSIFLGKVENQVQYQNRCQINWGDYIEEFSLPVQAGDSINWKYSQDEYLDKISHAKFGLCLAGYGPKCNREIEYLGLGVVPIITAQVDTTYYDALIEGVHYFKIISPFEIASIIESITESKWKEMSNACIEWYDKNCSREGSFLTTEKIINDE